MEGPPEGRLGSWIVTQQGMGDKVTSGKLSTADGTNDILSFPYKRENDTSRERGGKLSLEDGHREGGAIQEEPLTTIP